MLLPSMWDEDVTVPINEHALILTSLKPDPMIKTPIHCSGANTLWIQIREALVGWMYHYDQHYPGSSDSSGSDLLYMCDPIKYSALPLSRSDLL